MNFRGKPIDVLRLWAEYVDLPQNIDESHGFAPLVFCPNPDHPNSRSPAFQINLRKPMCHCFSYCGISGSLEHAICLIEGIYDKYEYDTELDEGKATREQIQRNRLKRRKAYREARKLIYKKALVPFGKAQPRNTRRVGTGSKKAVAAKSLTEIKLADYSYLPKEAINYLRDRNINPSSRARWQIGFDENTQRITIPVRDHRDRLRLLIRRGIYSYQYPAYLYSEESIKTSLLFGACNVDRSMVSSQGLIVVEGSLDTIRQHQDGYTNTVGILGAYISDIQVRLIARLQPKRVFLFFDNDPAGVRAIEAAAKRLKMYPLFVPVYPKGSLGADPASLSSKQRADAIRKAVPVLRVKRKIRLAKGAVKLS